MLSAELSAVIWQPFVPIVACLPCDVYNLKDWKSFRGRSLY